MKKYRFQFALSPKTTLKRLKHVYGQSQIILMKSLLQTRIKRFDKRNCQMLHGLRFRLQMEC